MNHLDFKIDSTDKHIHFVGIGGIGMSGIAEVLHNLGFHVSGSDVQAGATVKRLQHVGIPIHIGHRADNIAKADVIVTSTAVNADNVEVKAALKQHIPVVPRAQMLAELMHFKKGIAVAGTHGKTTTTSLLASIFATAELDPTFVIGGKLNRIGSNAHLGKGDYFIAEADESDASFLHLQPLIGIVTNIDEEHMAAYQHDPEALKQAFVDFLHRIPFYGLAVLCIDDPMVRDILPEVTCPVITYGESADADIQLQQFCQYGLQSNFRIKAPKFGLYDADIHLNMPGKHNALNALATLAVALHCKIPMPLIQAALADFAGVGRRSQVYGVKRFGTKEVVLIDDYGHHPTEIRVTIQAIKEAWPNGRVIHIFQPHRFTRTRDLFDDFVKALSEDDLLILLDVYPASERPIAKADSKALCRAIRQRSQLEPIHVSDFAEIPAILAKLVKDGDVVLTQGAGNVGQLIPDHLAAENMIHYNENGSSSCSLPRLK